ncbi:MAG: virulence RhuM family protein, partial [Desulfocapsa sp.]|nr:virulence RhuM family protein [Desulfocapsa sp.]
LVFNDRQVLEHAGSISKKGADEKAKTEYDQFAASRREQLEDQGARETLLVLEELGRRGSGSKGRGDVE